MNCKFPFGAADEEAADLPFLGVTGAAPAAASARRLPIWDRRKAGIDVRGVFIRLQLPINYPFDSGKQAGVL